MLWQKLLFFGLIGGRFFLTLGPPARWNKHIVVSWEHQTEHVFIPPGRRTEGKEETTANQPKEQELLPEVGVLDCELYSFGTFECPVSIPSELFRPETNSCMPVSQSNTM
jgi:hypothetical protein